LRKQNFLYFRFSIFKRSEAGRLHPPAKFENRLIEIRKSSKNRVSIALRRFDPGFRFARRFSMAFPFENLQAYQKSLDWIETVERLCSLSGTNMSRTYVDQFQRAALSISLNLAEGNGRWHSAEKRNFFWIARGSVFECVPLLELLRRKKAISSADYDKHRDTLDHLGKMLTNLVKAHE